jgi:hypothetical protein
MAQFRFSKPLTKVVSKRPAIGIAFNTRSETSEKPRSAPMQPPRYCILEVDPILNINRTISFASWILHFSIYCVVLAHIPGADRFDFPYLSHFILMLISSFMFQRSFRTKSPESPLYLVITPPVRFKDTSAIFICLSPCLGYFGTVCASYLVLNILETRTGAGIWIAWNCILAGMIGLRWVLEKHRKIRIYQWDECVPGDP